MLSAFVRSSLHRARLASRPAVRSYVTGPSPTNSTIEKAQKLTQKVRNYASSSNHFPLFFWLVTTDADALRNSHRRMNRLKTGRANSRKQQNRTSALLESVYQALQDVCSTPVFSHRPPQPLHTYRNYLSNPSFSFRVADIIVPWCVAYRQPLLYNFAVAREFLKQIYTAERLAPPTSLSQITSVYKQLYSNAISIPFWRELWTSGQWTKVAIYGLEAYGIFHIGEMIGRRHIIGYKLD